MGAGYLIQTTATATNPTISTGAQYMIGAAAIASFKVPATATNSDFFHMF